MCDVMAKNQYQVMDLKGLRCFLATSLTQASIELGISESAIVRISLSGPLQTSRRYSVSYEKVGASAKDFGGQPQGAFEKIIALE